MRFTDLSECLLWLISYGWLASSFATRASARPLAPDYELTILAVSMGIDKSGLRNIIKRRIPSEAVNKTTVASLLSEAAFHGGVSRDVLLWINEYGMWQQGNWDLFYGYRSYLGNTQNIRDSPCHICTQEDCQGVESVLCLVMYFMWGAVLVDQDRSFIFRIGHDDTLEIDIAVGANLTVYEQLIEFLDAGS